MFEFEVVVIEVVEKKALVYAENEMELVKKLDKKNLAKTNFTSQMGEIMEVNIRKMRPCDAAADERLMKEIFGRG